MNPQSRIISWNGLKMTVPQPCQEIISAPTHLLIESDYQPLAEIRWEKQDSTSGKSSTESVYREISRQKNSTCRKTQLPPPFARFARTKQALGVRWDGEGGELGIIWQCEQCRTLLFCHLYGHPAFSLEQTAELIMSVECCSSQDDFFTVWSLQDFSLRVPAAFCFDSSYFGAGLTRLTFQGAHTTLHICRLAPASEKLAEKSVREILHTLNDRFSSKESSCRETGDTLECWTNPSLLTQVHHRLRRKKAFCLGCIRHDDISNRLLAVTAESNRPIDPELPKDILHHYEIIR